MSATVIHDLSCTFGLSPRMLFFAVSRRLFKARRPAAARAAASARTRVRFGCVPLTLQVVSRTYMHPTAR